MTQTETDRFTLRRQAAALSEELARLSPVAALRAAARGFAGRIAVLSSFGAESAVLLHMVAEADPGLPVLLLDTGQLFPETLAYRDTLLRRLSLTDVRSTAPAPAALAQQDPDGRLHARDSVACCALRKIGPQEAALRGIAMVVTGRKRYQATTRAALPLVEAGTDGRLRLNPLAGWSAADIATYALIHELPPHPLAEQGYASIGCAPCTTRVAPGEDPRAGRWRGLARTECGMHPAAA